MASVTCDTGLIFPKIGTFSWIITFILGIIIPDKKLISIEIAIPRFILNSIDFLFDTPIRMPRATPARRYQG